MHRPAALQQDAIADADLDAADLLAAQRAQQRGLVRAERAPVGVRQTEVLRPLERMQLAVRRGAVEGQQAPVGVGDAHAVTELREHRRQEAALGLDRALQLELGPDVAQRRARRG